MKFYNLGHKTFETDFSCLHHQSKLEENAHRVSHYNNQQQTLMNPIQIMQQVLVCLKKNLPVQDFSVAYCTSVVLHSNREAILPFNAHLLLDHIRPIVNTDKTVFVEAAKDTNEQLVNAWEPTSIVNKPIRTQNKCR